MTLIEALGREIPDDRLVTDADVVASALRRRGGVGARRRGRGRARRRTEAEGGPRGHRLRGPRRPDRAPWRRHRALRRRATPSTGASVLDLSRMTAVMEVRTAENLIAVVEPGIVNDDLKAVVAEQGLWYPPDPALALVDDRRQRRHQRRRPVLREVRRHPRLRARLRP